LNNVFGGVGLCLFCFCFYLCWCLFGLVCFLSLTLEKC